MQIYRAPPSLSGQRFVLDGSDRRLGGAQWIGPDGASQALPHAVVSFAEVKEGAPVEGTYELRLPDRTRAHGRFRAGWWPADGPGG